MSDIPPQFASYPRPTDPRQYSGPPAFRIEAITEAWMIFKSDMATWVVIELLMAFIGFLTQLPGTVFAIMNTDHPAVLKTPTALALTGVFALLSAGVVGVLQGGFYRVILGRMRLQYEGILDIFKANGEGVKLILWSILLALPSLAASTYYTVTAPVQTNPQNPFGEINSVLILLVVLLLIGLLLFPFFLTPLIIVDKKLSIGEAAALSWKTVTRSLGKALAFYFCASVVSALGIVACGIGILFTLPLFSLSIAVAYRDHFMPPLASDGVTTNFEGPTPPSGTTAY